LRLRFRRPYPTFINPTITLSGGITFGGRPMQTEPKTYGIGASYLGPMIDRVAEVVDMFEIAFNGASRLRPTT
jgi:hypothetical protein